ncbi:Avidin-related protein 4/5, partial [Tinamus guttatus]
PLRGFQQRNEEQPTFGFTIKLTLPGSITVFAGQYFVDKNGKEVLKTTWLLRDPVDCLEDDWKATRVGVSTFTR